MMTKFVVIWFRDNQPHSRYCDSKSMASNFARKMSKDGKAKIYRCVGILNGGEFFETESFFVATYTNGKRDQ